MSMKTNQEKQVVKFTPDGVDGELAFKIFRKIWPEAYSDDTLTWKLNDRVLTFDGQAFTLKIKKAKLLRDVKGLKHEMKRSLEVFNMVLTMRLPLYSCPEFRQRLRAVQDEMGPKFIKTCARLAAFAEQLPEAKNSAKWGYENALITVNKAVKPHKEKA